MMEMDLDLDEMRAAKWWEVNIPPFGAVINVDKVEERNMDGPLVQITQVNSFEDIWVCPFPWDQRDELLTSMNKFYIEGEGRDWTIPDSEFCRGKFLMAAPYADYGYHRVIIKQVLSEEIISVLYIDYGSSGEVHYKDVRLIHKKFLTLPARAIPARLWGISEHENMVEISRLMLTKLMTEGNKHGFCCLVVSNVARRRSNGVLEQVSKPAVWLQDIMEDDSVNNILLRQNYASVDLADFLDKGLALDIKFAEVKNDDLFDVSAFLMNLLRGVPFVDGCHQDTTHMERNKSQACVETVESGKEFEISSRTDMGTKYEKLPNKDHVIFEELKESRIIDIEDDENEMEVKVKPRITVLRPQLFTKNTPGELRDVLEKVEKDCGIQGGLIKNQDLVLISKNDNYINQENLSLNDTSSITNASDSGVCSNNNENLLLPFGASSDN